MHSVSLWKLELFIRRTQALSARRIGGPASLPLCSSEGRELANKIRLLQGRSWLWKVYILKAVWPLLNIPRRITWPRRLHTEQVCRTGLPTAPEASSGSCPREAVLNVLVMTPLGVAYQISYISDIYIMTHNSSKIICIYMYIQICNNRYVHYDS